MRGCKREQRENVGLKGDRKAVKGHYVCAL